MASMLDIHPPEHAVHTLRDFFIHIATICVGLLIAIALEQGVESLHHHHQREYLEDQMHTESEQNLDLVRAQILFSVQRRAYLNDSIRALQAARPSGGQLIVTLPLDTVSMPASSQGLLISPSRGTWTVAKAAGTVALLPADTARVYARLDLCDEFEQQAENALGDTAAALASARLKDHAIGNGHPLHLTQPQVDDLIKAFSDASEATANFHFHFRLVVLEGALEAIVANASTLQQMYPYQVRSIAREGAAASANRARDTTQP
jgi:hypothetical protein